ncbi:MAG: hypothetical protein A2846_04795 [Candidatus Doudnabacteria bacterium RIFCSPHIGHO2_01_FULL_49_9]|uniref:Cytoskeleton protein RodZ-like C-terminal domain-containing protein n=1 Tax=Candidatus Doudnabacteria bacterium RIFCSPHIGHO2_01_FULL_49_9 TaxID=1817827 RepID=A0A1F5P1M7_9BACT|nr:MAG: hypothetical protein A2846_04795 [Candidatus Doudnabacteria bacterium RIFCSPHIGHO2_01_FULL_49_9]
MITRQRMTMFKTKPVRFSTLGEYLVSLRAHLGMSVTEISKVAKIPPKYITALEDGDYARLPATVYVRGFLKTLAEIYRVEHKNLLALYEQEKGLSDQLATPAPDTANPGRAMPRFIFSPRTLIAASVILLGLGSIGYLYLQISSVRRPPLLEVFSPEGDGAVDSSFLALDGRTEPGTNVYLNNQPVVVDANGKFHENLSLAPGMNQLVITATNKFDKHTIITRQVLIPEKQIAGAQDNDTLTASVEDSNLDLEILVGPETAWMSVEVDSQIVFTGTMLPGSARRVSGQFVRLSTTNAGAVRVALNGQDLGVLGKDGETLRDVEFSK